MTLEVVDFPTVATAAVALADAVAHDLRAALTTRPRALLLVSGGRSPLPFFAALTQQVLPWERVDVSLVDERSVAADSAEANALLVQQHLLVGAAASARWIALLPAAVFGQAADPMAAARRAAAQAAAEPLLAAPDAVILGMGNDGHTASLFADAPQWADAVATTDRYIALQPGAAPHARISLSLQALRGQKRCYLWATGPAKMATLQRLQQGGAIGPVALLVSDPGVILTAYCSRTD